MLALLRVGRRISLQHWHIAMSTPDDKAESPVAQKVFDAIDTNKDGLLSTDEIVAYFVDQLYDTERTMTFLKVIDTDADGNVTEDEWHAAWRNGSFDVDETGRGTHKEQVMSKHLSAQSQSIQSSRASTADATSEPSTPAQAKKSRRFSIILARVQDARGAQQWKPTTLTANLSRHSGSQQRPARPECFLTVPSRQRAGRGGLSVE
jgi:hypothetical protein